MPHLSTCPPPLFSAELYPAPCQVCVRHGSNTWRWSEGSTARFARGEGARALPSSVLRSDDRAFALKMRSSGALAALSSRRAASPAPKLEPAP